MEISQFKVTGDFPVQNEQGIFPVQNERGIAKNTEW
jgi:hypothetical protein